MTDRSNGDVERHAPSVPSATPTGESVPTRLLSVRTFPLLKPESYLRRLGARVRPCRPRPTHLQETSLKLRMAVQNLGRPLLPSGTIPQTFYPRDDVRGTLATIVGDRAAD